MTDPALQRAAGLAALAAAATGLLYSISFVLVSRVSPAAGGLLSALFLVLGGLLTVVVLAGVYDRRREARPALALLVVVLGAAGALGAAIHGGFDLANAIHPPGALTAGLPNAVDPRGMLTFGVAGLAVIGLGLLIGGGPGRLGYFTGALLIVVYLARLIILSPTNLAVLLPAALAGFIVNPVFYAWLGLWLLRPSEGAR